MKLFNKEIKMKKKLLVILSASLVIVLVLTACGGGAEVKPSVKSVTFAEKLDENYQAVNPKTQFKPTDVVYASVDITGRPKTGILLAKFYYGDQLITEATVDFSSVNSGVLFSIGEDTFAGFTLTGNQAWPVSKDYRMDLFLDSVKVGSYPYEVIQ
jgi:hypothetical protein